MENNMELEHTHLQAVKQSKENGKKEKDYTGSKMLINDQILSDFYGHTPIRVYNKGSIEHSK